MIGSYSPDKQQHGSVADDGVLKSASIVPTGQRAQIWPSPSMIAVPKYVESSPPVEAAATYGTSSVQVTELLIGKLSDSGSSRSSVRACPASGA